MGRGRSSSGGGRGSSSSSRGSSSSSWGRRSSHTTVIIGGNRAYHSGGGISSKTVSILIGIIFLIVGISLFAGGISIFNESKKYGEIQGKAIDNTYSGGWYYTTYEYTINGTEYENRSNEGWEFPEVEGRTVTIYYLKDDPNEITEKKPADVGSGVVLLVMGAIFGGVGAFLLVKGIKNKENDNSNPPVENKEMPIDNTVTCPYCGTKYNKNLNSCPKCGAGRS